MRNWLCLVFVVTGLFGAPEIKVPAAREALLKQRASKFWQFFVDGKFRLAEPLVSPDSQDYYYSWPKKQIRKFRIEKIEYSEAGKRALVIAVADTDMTLMGAGTMAIEQPVYTHWRFEKGSWFWFYPRNEMRQTPFGPMPTGDGNGTGQAAKDMAFMVRGGPKLADLERMVLPDRNSVEFVAGEAKEEFITMQNSMQGTVSLKLSARNTDELSCVLEANEIPAKGSVKLLVRYRPAEVKAGERAPVSKTDCVVAVAQTGKAHAIHIQVGPKPSR